jgi:hypothetical protein
MNSALLSTTFLPFLFVVLTQSTDVPKAIPSKPQAEGAAKEIKPIPPSTKIQGEPARPATPPRLATPNIDRARRTMMRPPSPLPPTVVFREPTEREIAAAALGRIGRAAVPSLIQALKNRDPDVRKEAALVLARIGPDAFQAVPDLTALLDDENEEVRKAAARALGQIGPDAAEAVPALMRLLVQPSPMPPERP